jgi:hypothetical protein
VPGSLEEALDALEEDHQFLLKGGVFTEDLIRTWIDYSGPRRPTRCGCARTRGSSRSTTTSERGRYSGTVIRPAPATCTWSRVAPVGTAVAKHS